MDKCLFGRYKELEFIVGIWKGFKDSAVGRKCVKFYCSKPEMFWKILLGTKRKSAIFCSLQENSKIVLLRVGKVKIYCLKVKKDWILLLKDEKGLNSDVGSHWCSC